MVLPFSSVCLSYALTVALDSWHCGFSLRTSSLVVPACVCRSFLGWRSCVFFLSSCSARGRLLLSLLLVLLLCLFLRFFRGVSCRRLPLGGYATFLAPVACPAPAVELCMLGLRCLWCVLGFQPIAVLFLRGLRFCAACPAAGCPSGFLPDLLLRWWRRLGGNPSFVLSVLLLHRLACRGSLGSAPCVRELP